MSDTVTDYVTPDGTNLKTTEETVLDACRGRDTSNLMSMEFKSYITIQKIRPPTVAQDAKISDRSASPPLPLSPIPESWALLTFEAGILPVPAKDQ